MAPTLRDGDALLVRRGGRATRPGDVVVATFRSRPDLLVVKRAVRTQEGGWWVRGDNALVTDDSRAYGVADVRGRVLLRYWPRFGRLPRPHESQPDDPHDGPDESAHEDPHTGPRHGRRPQAKTEPPEANHG